MSTALLDKQETRIRRMFGAVINFELNVRHGLNIYFFHEEKLQFSCFALCNLEGFLRCARGEH